MVKTQSTLFWKFFAGYTGVAMIVAGVVAIYQLQGYEGQLTNWAERVQLVNGNLETSELFSVWRQTKLYVLETILVGIVISLGLATVLAMRMTQIMGQMLRVSESMLDGRYDERILSLPADEMIRLGRTLNRLSSEITSKIETISLERAQLKTILANMVEGIICVDAFGDVQFCNEAAYRLFSVTKSDVRGMNIQDVIGFNCLSDIAQLARQDRQVVSKELRLIQDDELKKLYLQVHASPFESDTSSGVILVVHDVTKMRQLEKMRRDFVANVSHEIKTPLTAIRGYIETLLNEEIEEQAIVHRFLEKVDSNAKRLNNLVIDILTLAQIEEGEGNFALSPISWGPIVSQVKRAYEDLCAEKGLQLDVNSQVSCDKVLGVRESMLQVLENLVSNAVRYTPSGGKIIVEIIRTSATVRLLVRDTGIGIPQKDQIRIFERFYRVDKARSREVGGTGLGLAIVKHLVLSMGGSIDVESVVGSGSVFSVDLRPPEEEPVGVSSDTSITG